MCLGEGPFVLRSLGFLLASRTCISSSFPRFGKFTAIISLNKLSALFSLSSPSGIPVTLIFPFPKESDNSHRIFLSFYILFLPSSTHIISIYLSSSSLILSSILSDLFSMLSNVFFIMFIAFYSSRISV